jgi:SAM-dependent methyltransferase
VPAMENPYTKSSFVVLYDRVRPKPPNGLVPLIAQLSGRDPPALVVDLGSGTGLSTVAWSRHASRVIGIESNPQMLNHARRAANVEYRQAPADATGVKARSADVVTCSQSFHWMLPQKTLREVDRILRRGGVFAAYDYRLPPLIEPRLDEAFDAVLTWAGMDRYRPEKTGYSRKLARSGRFRWTKEFPMHGYDAGDAQRVLELASSLGGVAALLEERNGRRAACWRRFVRVASQTLGTSRRRFWWTYNVVLAVK